MVNDPKAYRNFDFGDLETLQSLYPVAVLQYRYGHGWFAIANSDGHSPLSPIGKTRLDWAQEDGPNGSEGAPFDSLGGFEPDWIAYGDSPDVAVATLVTKQRNKA